jgi:hypothetical protein
VNLITLASLGIVSFQTSFVFAGFGYCLRALRIPANRLIREYPSTM